MPEIPNVMNKATRPFFSLKDQHQSKVNDVYQTFEVHWSLLPQFPVPQQNALFLMLILCRMLPFFMEDNIVYLSQSSLYPFLLRLTG